MNTTSILAKYEALGRPRLFGSVIKSATAFVLILLTVGACAKAEANAYNVQRLVSFRSVAFIRAEDVSVAKITQPQGSKLGRMFRRRFHGYFVVSEWILPDREHAEKLVAWLRQSIESGIEAYSSAGDQDVVELSPFCIPNPGYAVRLETEKGPRDFLICLECGEVTVHGGGKGGLSFWLDDGEIAKLKECYKEEFSVKRDKIYGR